MPVLVFVLIISLASSCSVAFQPADVDSSDEDFSEGISRIHELEGKDPNNVDAIIKEFRRQELFEKKESQRQELIAEYEALIAPLKEDPSAVWAMYEDYVIIGDSRGADFKNISALDKSRNLAVYANTANKLADYYDEIEALNPSYIFVSIGVVDALADDLEDIDDYKEYMTPLIQDLKDHFPDALIFLNPLFHSVGEGLEKFPRWNRIDEYDAVIREIADEVGVYYVNCDDILPTKKDYIDDGIHFKNEFMNRWAIRYIETLYRIEFGIDDFDDNYADDYDEDSNA